MVCGGLWWFAVVCGGLWWIAVVCLLVIPLLSGVYLIYARPRPGEVKYPTQGVNQKNV